MTPLKKYIRPQALKRFLEKALDAAGSGSMVAIEYEGEMVLVAGGDSPAEFDAGAADVLSEPISFNSIHSGRLLLKRSGDFEESGRLLSFMAYTLQGYVDMEAARRSIGEDSLAKYRELALLYRSVPEINTSLRLRDVVGALLNECRRENYPGEVGMVFLSDPTSNRFKLFTQFGLPFGSNPDQLAESRIFQNVIFFGRSEIVDDLDQDERWHGEIPRVRSMALIPIVSPNRCEGMLVLASENTGLFEAAHAKSLSTLASVAGISVSNAFNFEGVQRLMDAMLKALAEAIDSRDPFTAGHSERVAQLAVAFALVLNESPEFSDMHFSDADLREIYYAGILHDVGKIGIREDVLTKDSRLPKRRLEVIRSRFQIAAHAGKLNWVEAFECVRNLNTAMNPRQEDLDFVRSLSGLHWGENDERMPLLYSDELEALLLPYGNLTPDERREIERHPAESERILQHIPLQEGFVHLLTIIRQHHERMDGSGYPDGVTGNEILLQSRLMAIVDIYDAVTQERHYKPAYTRREAMNILSGDAERGKLDAVLVNLFQTNLARVEELAERVKGSRINHIAEITGSSMFSR